MACTSKQYHTAPCSRPKVVTAKAPYIRSERRRDEVVYIVPLCEVKRTPMVANATSKSDNKIEGVFNAHT